MAQEQLVFGDINLHLNAFDRSNKRKISFRIDTNHHISIFKNDAAETVINIRKGTRSVSISKDMWTEMCDLKESVLLCASFIDN